MADVVKEISDGTFKEEVLDAKGVVLVDFWAAWCPPCVAMAPVYEKVAAKYAGKAKFCKLDVQQNEESPSQYGIMNIPTLKIFKDGNEVETLVGLQEEASLSAIIDKEIEGK
jgi:thioredoxin 1